MLCRIYVSLAYGAASLRGVQLLRIAKECNGVKGLVEGLTWSMLCG